MRPWVALFISCSSRCSGVRLPSRKAEADPEVPWPEDQVVRLPWQTDNLNGDFPGSYEVMCPVHTIVQKVVGVEREWYGLVNMHVHCSRGYGEDGPGEKHVVRSLTGTEFDGPGNKNNSEAECPLTEGDEWYRGQPGMVGINTSYQGWHGIVNFRYKCASGKSGYSNNNMDGEEHRGHSCAQYGYVMVGMQVRAQSRFGIVNYRSICAPQLRATQVVGQWMPIREMKENTTSIGVNRGTRKQHYLATTTPWVKSVTALVGNDLILRDQQSNATAKPEEWLASWLVSIFEKEWAMPDTAQITIPLQSTGGQNFDGPTAGLHLWQWQFKIVDSYGNHYDADTQSIAITNGLSQPPRCYPFGARDTPFSQDCIMNTIDGDFTLPFFQEAK